MFTIISLTVAMDTVALVCRSAAKLAHSKPAYGCGISSLVGLFVLWATTPSVLIRVFQHKGKKEQLLFVERIWPKVSKKLLKSQ